MKQRLCLARTLLQDPQLFILDEPASGLDPHARIEIRDLIRSLAQMGKTVFISSHILAELADFCTHIGIIESGKLVCSGQKDEMLRLMQPVRVLQIVPLDPAKCQDILSRNDYIISFKREQDAFTVNLADDNALAERLIYDLVQQSARPVSVSEKKLDLEGLFMKITKGEVK